MNARIYSVVLLSVLLWVLAACTARPQSSPVAPAQLVEPVAVQVSAQTPAVNLRRFALARASSGGAGVTTSANGVAAGPVAQLLAPYMRVASSSGGNQTAELIASERLAIDAAAQLGVARMVGDHVIDNLRAEQVRMVDTPSKAGSRLEIIAKELGFEEGQHGPGSFALYVRVDAQWHRGSMPSVTRPMVYRSVERKLSLWDETVTGLELQHAYRALGERVVESFVTLSNEFPAGVGSACGLRWNTPDREYRPYPGAALNQWNRFTKVESRQPRLAWESLTEHASRAGVVLNARNISYQLRVWQDTPHVPLLVYARDGLTQPEHTLESVLEPGTRYYWSVRARYRATDGGRRTTVWSRFRLPYAGGLTDSALTDHDRAMPGLVRDPCALDFIATPNYYRFATP